MKRFWIILIAAALSACTQQAQMDNGTVLALGEGWKLSRTGGPESVTAVVPSTVAGSLYASGYYGDDLFVARNYAKADKTMFDDEWVYRTEFDAKPSKGQHAELVFDGIDYRADIFLNGIRFPFQDDSAEPVSGPAS